MTFGETNEFSPISATQKKEECHMRVLLGIAIATALVITAWSIDPTVGKTRRALRIDPTGMMTTAADLPPEQFDAF
jgi:hypothetical protein